MGERKDRTLERDDTHPSCTGLCHLLHESARATALLHQDGIGIDGDGAPLLVETELLVGSALVVGQLSTTLSVKDTVHDLYPLFLQVFQLTNALYTGGGK